MTDSAPDASPRPSTAPGALSPELEAIRAGYTFEAASIRLGSALSGGAPAPDVAVNLPLGMLNRHGLIAGATGTGKTITLQVLTEALSNAGVPVFAADMKGDLSGLGTAGTSSEKLLDRTRANGQQWEPQAAVVDFYSLGGLGSGIPLRATVSSFGPLLLSKVLGLNETQESVLGLLFHYADSAGLALLDLSDLKAVLSFLDSDEGRAELKGIGGVSPASVGVILRAIAGLEAQGADAFFGEPEFETADLLRQAADGRGVVSLLELPAVQDRPQLFSTFLMWLLAELFHDLPEVGDPDKPTLVFFFDEAHLLFKDASKAFLDSVAQTVRLIRSKGVGIFFVTQSPSDVPDEVLAQLSSRVQHALRAHTPKDAKALKQTVETYPSVDFDLGAALTSLGTGQAVVTVMDPDGAPTPVALTAVFAPESRMGATEATQIDAAVSASALQAKYGAAIDRESAREILTARLEKGAEAAQQPAPSPAPDDSAQAPRLPLPSEEHPREEKSGPSVLEQVVKSSAFKQFTRTAAREIARGIFGTGRRRR